MATVQSRLTDPVMRPAQDRYALEAISLSRRFASLLAVDDLNLRIEAGEIFCLLGPNGAGKTTTINMFLGFVPPSSGSARVCGVDVAVDPIGSKRRLAYIPEQVMLYRNLTGEENLEYFSALAGQRLERVRLQALLLEAGLPAAALGRRVGEYSKGMRQKVGIAIALAKKADALLLDEPTSGLDPQAANEFSALLQRLSRAGVGILMATHDLFRAKSTGTRVGIMKHGRLVGVHNTDALDHAQLERIYLEHMSE
jgi:ABC-2 type transport system ATP-binding protein